MRVWGLADPRLLKDKHLLGEHNEIHVLLKGKWPNHPESLSKRFDGDIEWLVFRHEMIRIALSERYGDHHYKMSHLSPAHDNVDQVMQVPVLAISNTRFQDLLDIYEEVGFHNFAGVMHYIEFPSTGLDEDTPWDREGITIKEYHKIEGVRK